MPARRLLPIVLALVLCSCCTTPSPPVTTEPPPATPQAALATTPVVDELTGLKIADGWTTVRANCVGCHSGRHFLRQTGTRDTWQDAIRWMQRYQGLWQMPPAIESEILDYLAANYAPSAQTYRRAPLQWTQLPKNPYGTPIPITPVTAPIE
jgi:hypothetical protein